MGHLPTPSLGLLVVDRIGGQVRVDRELTTRHRIEREPRCDLANPCRPFGNHHKVNQEDDQKKKDPHLDLVAGNKRPKGLDHPASDRRGTSRILRQNQASRRDVQRQASEGRRQKDRRKYAELQRSTDR